MANSKPDADKSLPMEASDKPNPDPRDMQYNGKASSRAMTTKEYTQYTIKWFRVLLWDHNDMTVASSASTSGAPPAGASFDCLTGESVESNEHDSVCNIRACRIVSPALLSFFNLSSLFFPRSTNAAVATAS
mmetsp:Transcript_49163/g.74766  ORF Transcript_49163/g.74766 Transcript_49163/m.74766 type:complete len:132 (-) Transcript_49163:1111-1506(-)